MSDALIEALGLISGGIIFVGMMRLLAWVREQEEERQRRERERKRIDEFFKGGGGRFT